jgi:hypothetical protein
MNPAINMDTVWAALSNCAEFRENDFAPEVIEVHRQYLYGLPAVLEDLLDQRAYVTTLAEAKKRYLQYFIDSGYIEALFAATPPEDEDIHYNADDAIRTKEYMRKWITVMETGLEEFRVNGNTAGLFPDVSEFPDELTHKIAHGMTISQFLEEAPWYIVL